MIHNNVLHNYTCFLNTMYDEMGLPPPRIPA